MKSNIISSLILGSAAMLAVSSAQAFTFQQFNPTLGLTEAQWMASVFLGDNSDITLVPGSAKYTGNYLYQGGTTSDGGLVLSNGRFLEKIPGYYGIHNGVNTPANTGGNAALSALIGGTPTYDQNVLTFQFTVNDPSIDSITTSFIFASDEFGNAYKNNDVFAFWVDDVNYALLPDGKIVSVHNIGENWVDGKDYGYNGRTEEISITALLDPNRTTHTITIAIADATNTGGLSAVLFGPVAGANSNPTIPAIPEPETWAMMLAGLGIVGMTAKRRRRQK